MQPLKSLALFLSLLRVDPAAAACLYLRLGGPGLRSLGIFCIPQSASLSRFLMIKQLLFTAVAASCSRPSSHPPVSSQDFASRASGSFCRAQEVVSAKMCHAHFSDIASFVSCRIRGVYSERQGRCECMMRKLHAASWSSYVCKWEKKLSERWSD